MYSIRPNFVLGFHGCEQQLAEDVVMDKKHLRTSDNSYDWLGHGMYFWESDPIRAFEFAMQQQNNTQKNKKSINEPGVLGAVLSLGHCFDTLNRDHILYLKDIYQILVNDLERIGKKIPENHKGNIDNSIDLTLRELDCAVFEYMHYLREESNLKAYDSVKSVFWEGDFIYPSAGFREKDHIQICIRNPNCIKGYFLPRKQNTSYKMV